MYYLCTRKVNGILTPSIWGNH